MRTDSDEPQVFERQWYSLTTPTVVVYIVAAPWWMSFLSPDMSSVVYEWGEKSVRW